MGAVELAFFLFVAATLYKAIGDFISDDKESVMEARSRQVRTAKVSPNAIRSTHNYYNTSVSGKKAKRTSLQPVAKRTPAKSRPVKSVC